MGGNAHWMFDEGLWTLTDVLTLRKSTLRALWEQEV
jgi:hypothetical protein